MDKDIISLRDVDINFDDYILLKELDYNSRKKIEHRLRQKQLNRYITSKGVAINKAEYLKVYERETRGRTPKVINGYQIDLSQPSRMNVLYRRFVDMNKKNQNFCKCDNRLPRYVDQNGYACINLKDYIRPQIKQLASKLECKEYQVAGALFDLMIKLHKEDLKNSEEE